MADLTANRMGGYIEDRAAGARNPRASLRVWDPIVRVFHWAVVGGCVLNLFIVDDASVWHLYIGYAVAAALFVRLLWGLVGSRHARFGDFVPAPSRLLDYLVKRLQNREPRYVGHNPAAAIMILALMLSLIIVSVSGWMITLEAYFGVEWVEDLHTRSADAILWLAGLHAAAALFESHHHGENLVWSMITGRKRP